MATGFCTFDETEFPLVKVTFNYRDPDLESFKEFILQQKKLLAMQKQYVLLMDATKLGFLSSEVRILQGTFFKEFAQPLKTYCLGAVAVVSSPLVKLMVKAMMLIAPPPNTSIVCTNAVEARRYAEALLSKNDQILKTADRI